MFRAINISSSAPTVNDDRDNGFVVGSGWFYTTMQKFYILVDDAAGAADWDEVSAGTVSTWEDWTPSYTWTGNTPTGVSSVARFMMIGTLCYFTLQVSGTTAGVGNLTNMSATLPAIATVVDNNSLVPIESYRDVDGTSARTDNIASIDSVADPARLNHSSFASIGTGLGFTLYYSGFYETQ